MKWALVAKDRPLPAISYNPCIIFLMDSVGAMNGSGDLTSDLQMDKSLPFIRNDTRQELLCCELS